MNSSGAIDDTLPTPPTSEREAIRMLANAVGLIAWRCWEALGTTESERIQLTCNVIGDWAVEDQRGE